MQNEIKTWLNDIQRAVNEISSFVTDKKDFHSFEKDIKTRRAVERNVEIIGEAINRILKIEPDISITNSRKVVDTRNRIIHGYDSVSAEILWSIVIAELPLLKTEIDRLLTNYA